MTGNGLPATKTHPPPDIIQSTVTNSELPPAISKLPGTSESPRVQRRLEDFSRLSSEWFWEMDDRLRYCYLSERFTEITGIPTSLVLAMTDDEIGLVEYDPDAWRKHLAKLRDHRSFRNFRYSLTHPDGHTVYVSISGDAMFDQSGTFLGYRGTGAEHGILSDAHAETEERLHELCSNAREVFWVLSADWRRVFYVSPAYEKVWGRTCQSLMDHPMSWIESLHPDDRDLILARLRNKISDKDSDPNFPEFRIIRPDGSVRWLTSHAYPIRDDNGKIVRFAGIGEDITERKESTDALHHAQKMDAVGQLTGGVAHDFNNLLAVMLGNAELLQDRLSPEDKVLVGDIIQAGIRGTKLTRQLLALSRQQPLDPVPTDPNALVNNMVGFLRRTLGTIIVIDIAVSPRPMTVMVDPNQLENALLNLALNARDAMPDGGALSIQVLEERVPRSSAQDPQAGKSVWRMKIVVQDDGAGMAADVLSRALEPFFTTKAIGQGNGLGLPMVYGFAKQSKGDLVVESEQGKGTKVTLSLPCTRDVSD